MRRSLIAGEFGLAAPPVEETSWRKILMGDYHVPQEARTDVVEFATHQRSLWNASFAGYPSLTGCMQAMYAYSAEEEKQLALGCSPHLR